MGYAFVVCIATALAIGNITGYSSGQSNLCEKQFQGEMHEGKCVKVQREELK